MSNEFVMVPREAAKQAARLLAAHSTGPSLERDTAEELRDALEKPAQHQDEPVPITNDMHRLMEAYRLGEFTAEGGSDTIEALAVASFDTVADQGHDADSYMAGFCASLYWQAAPFIGLAIKPSTNADPGEVEQMRGYVRRLEKSLKYWTEKTEWLQDSYRPHEIGEHRVDVLMDMFNTLRAQRSEQAALLREWLGGNFTFFGLVDLRKRTDAVLSASAEPSAPKCKSCGQVPEGQGGEYPCKACGLPTVHDEPSAPVDRAHVPDNCRQRLRAEGKPYPRSSCAACGKFSPKWRECDAALERKPS